MVLALAVAPNAGGTDAYIFKAAGCNLALGDGFTAAALPGSGDAGSHLFAAYAPGLPLLFGAYASVFGCSGHANTWFDLLVGIGATVAVAAVVERHIAGSLRRAAAALLGATLPGGFASAANDRPEALALIGIAVVCMAARRERARGESRARRARTGLLAGATTLVHPFAGALAFLAAWTIRVTRGTEAAFGLTAASYRSPVREAAREAVAMAVPFAVPVVAVVLGYLAMDPGSAARFANHAFGAGLGLGALASARWLDSLGHAFFSAGVDSFTLAGAFVVVAFAIVAWLAAGLRRRTDPRNAIAFVAFAAVAVLPVALFPAQNNYYGLARATLILMVACTDAPLATGPLRGPIVTGAVIASCVAMLPALGLTTLTRIESRGAYARAVRDASALADTLAAQHASGLVLVPASHFFVYRPFIRALANPGYLDPATEATSPIAGVVSCLRGTLPGDALTPGALGGEAVLVTRQESKPVPVLFGRRVTRRRLDWGCTAWTRTPVR